MALGLQARGVWGRSLGNRQALILATGRLENLGPLIATTTGIRTEGMKAGAAVPQTSRDRVFMVIHPPVRATTEYLHRHQTKLVLNAQSLFKGRADGDV